MSTDSTVDEVVKDERFIKRDGEVIARRYSMTELLKGKFKGQSEDQIKKNEQLAEDDRFKSFFIKDDENEAKKLSIHNGDIIKERKLEPKDRRIGKNTKEIVDVTKIAVISLESGKGTFSKRYSKIKVEDNNSLIASGGRGRGKKFYDNTTDMSGKSLEQLIEKELESKVIPNVICVIESDVSVKNLKIKNHSYSMVYQIEGKNKKGDTDHKQSMTAYVRNDISKQFKVEVHDINQKALNHKCLLVQWQVDNQKYGHLIVHIPNEYVKTKKLEGDVIDAINISEYDKLKARSIILTGVSGDTNFSQKLTALENKTVPSINGFSHDGKYDACTSSSAANGTAFMQSIPRYDERYISMQASTLNRSVTKEFISVGEGKEKEQKQGSKDHISMMVFVGHDKVRENLSYSDLNLT
ncbi:hypothetical protein [Cysteiniphilum sp. JM-1]|uniref:hypothetical protein n=1 Tax=Cysteiniphilum sp. JM-1 TaxID=2610891 RepID=UPI0012493731|nr:hypothetical protein [Cysteiniphilum sp. JM-1]